MPNRPLAVPRIETVSVESPPDTLVVREPETAPEKPTLSGSETAMSRAAAAEWRDFAQPGCNGPASAHTAIAIGTVTAAASAPHWPLSSGRQVVESLHATAAHTDASANTSSATIHPCRAIAPGSKTVHQRDRPAGVRSQCTHATRGTEPDAHHARNRQRQQQVEGNGAQPSQIVRYGERNGITASR